MQSSKLSDSDSTKKFRFLGQRIPLRESEQKIRGSLFYAGDLDFAGMLHIRLVGSPYAHARIVSMSPWVLLAGPPKADACREDGPTGSAALIKII